VVDGALLPLRRALVVAAAVVQRHLMRRQAITPAAPAVVVAAAVVIALALFRHVVCRRRLAAGRVHRKVNSKRKERRMSRSASCFGSRTADD
jgi:hypothetical protein